VKNILLLLSFFLLLGSCGDDRSARPRKAIVKKGVKGLESSLHEKLIFLTGERSDTSKVIQPIVGESIQYLATLEEAEVISFVLEEKLNASKGCEFTYTKVRILEEVAEVIDEDNEEDGQKMIKVIKTAYSPVDLEYTGFPSEERKKTCVESAKTKLLKKSVRKIDVLKDTIYTKDLVIGSMLNLIDSCNTGKDFSGSRCQNLDVNLFKELVGQIKVGDSIFDFRSNMEFDKGNKNFEMAFSLRHNYFLFGGLYSSQNFQIIPNLVKKEEKGDLNEIVGKTFINIVLEVEPN